MAEPKKPANAPQESGEAPKKEAPGIVAANGRAQERLIQANKADKPTPKKKEEPAKKEKPTPKKTEKQPTKGTEEKPEPAKPEKKEKNWHLVR